MALSELLWPFVSLPETYVAIDTETTGLFNGVVAPDVISIGITKVENCKLNASYEFRARPAMSYTDDSDSVHGIKWEQAQCFEPLSVSWPEINDLILGRLIVFHNALFDWRVLIAAATRNDLKPLAPSGVFCSQRAAQPWAMAKQLKCSERGPSLDALASYLHLDCVRSQFHLHHSSSTDSELTANVVERLRLWRD